MKSDKSYKELSQDLDEILAQLQTNDLDIDEAIKLYEKGVEVTKQLEAYLKTAEIKINKVRSSSGE